MEHRAIRILRPTTEHSGRYMCKVSSLHDEDFRVGEMIVFCEFSA